MLRTIYRDDRSIMLVALPGPSGSRPTGDCAQALLIDPATGRAQPISAAEATSRQKSMQLAGAVAGTCPR
jgi:hypothetical protein